MVLNPINYHFSRFPLKSPCPSHLLLSTGPPNSFWRLRRKRRCGTCCRALRTRAAAKVEFTCEKMVLWLCEGWWLDGWMGHETMKAFHCAPPSCRYDFKQNWISLASCKNLNPFRCRSPVAPVARTLHRRRNWSQPKVPGRGWPYVAYMAFHFAPQLQSYHLSFCHHPPAMATQPGTDTVPNHISTDVSEEFLETARLKWCGLRPCLGMATLANNLMLKQRLEDSHASWPEVAILSIFTYFEFDMFLMCFWHVWHPEKGSHTRKIAIFNGVSFAFQPFWAISSSHRLGLPNVPEALGAIRRVASPQCGEESLWWTNNDMIDIILIS